jgi:hypothetical protein
MNEGYTPIWAFGDAGHIKASRPSLKVCAQRWNATTHQRATIRLNNSGRDDFANVVVHA